MNFNIYTIKSQEVINKATEIAGANGQQTIEPGHLLKAILETDENVIGFLLKKLSINKESVAAKVDVIIKSYPKVSGTQQTFLSNDAAAVLQKAESVIKKYGDEFVAVEHLLIGLLEGKDKTAGLLKEFGLNKKDLEEAIKELRGGNTVKDKKQPYVGR